MLEAVRGVPRGQLRPVEWLGAEAGVPGATTAELLEAVRSGPAPVLIPVHRLSDEDGRLVDCGLPTGLVERLRAHESIDEERLGRFAAAGTHYLGSGTTRIFCYPTCAHARRITDRHRVPFGSVAAARGVGLSALPELSPRGGLISRRSYGSAVGRTEDPSVVRKALRGRPPRRPASGGRFTAPGDVRRVRVRRPGEQAPPGQATRAPAPARALVDRPRVPEREAAGRPGVRRWSSNEQGEGETQEDESRDCVADPGGERRERGLAARSPRHDPYAHFGEDQQPESADRQVHRRQQ